MAVLIDVDESNYFSITSLIKNNAFLNYFAMVYAWIAIWYIVYIVRPCTLQIGSDVMAQCMAVCFCFTLHGLSGFTSPYFHRTTFQVIGSSYLALRSSEAEPPGCTPVPVSLSSSNIPHINLDRTLNQWRAPSPHWTPVTTHPGGQILFSLPCCWAFSF